MVDPILVLPSEVVLQCLSFVPSDEWFKIMRLSKAWYQITQTESLWRAALTTPLTQPTPTLLENRAADAREPNHRLFLSPVIDVLSPSHELSAVTFNTNRIFASSSQSSCSSAASADSGISTLLLTYEEQTHGSETSQSSEEEDHDSLESVRRKRRKIASGLSSHSRPESSSRSNRGRQTQYPIKLSDWILNPKACYKELALLSRMAYSSHMQIIESGIESSTFDNEKQTIHSVLDESPKSLWSSIGSKTADVDEFLTFRLIQPACIVTRIELIPFKAFYQRGAPVYGPREISVSIGFHTSLKRMHYTSERYQLENEHKVQVINIAPTLVVGEFVRLNLFGRFQKQSDDNLFYSTLQNVKCYGIPLGMCSSLRWISRSLLRLALLLTDERHSEEYRRGAGHNRSNAAVEKVMQRLKTQIQPELAYRAKMIFTRKQHAQKIMMGEWKSVAREIACHNWRHELRSQKYLEWFKKTVQEYFNKREQRTDAASYTTVWGTTINPSDSSGSSSSDHSDLDQPTSATEAPAQSPHVTSPMFILPDSGQAQNPMVFYLDCLHHLGSFLNAYETMEMARISVESKSVHRMSHAFFANRFECTEELGDFFASHQHTPIALSIYSRAHITDKIIELSIQLLYFTTIFEYIRDSHDANYCKQIIRRVRQKIGLVNAVQFSCQLLCLEPQFRNAVVEVFQVASETSHIVELNDLVAWLGNWAMVKEMQVDDQ